MSDHDRPPTSQRTHLGTMLLTIFGLAIAIGAWQLYDATLRPTPAAPSAQSAEAWPTLPATVTPLPVDPTAPAPTPTPLPTPAIERIAEFATLAYSFDVVKELQPEPGSTLWQKLKQALPGEDRVIIETSWRARYGLQLHNSSTLAPVVRDRDDITLHLPPVTLLGIEQIGPTRPLLTSQQALLSDYPGLESEARNLAQIEARLRAEGNTEMIGIAQDLAQLRLTAWMRNLGYSAVTITFDVEPGARP